MHQLLSSAIFIFISGALWNPKDSKKKRPKSTWWTLAEASEDVTYGMMGLISEVRKGVNEDFNKGAFLPRLQATVPPRAEVQKQEPFPKDQSIRVFCDTKVAFLLCDTLVIKDPSPVFRKLCTSKLMAKRCTGSMTCRIQRFRFSIL